MYRVFDTPVFVDIGVYVCGCVYSYTHKDIYIRKFVSMPSKFYIELNQY